MFKVFKVQEPVTAANDRDADLLRSQFKQHGIYTVNLMSSPGSGKTTLLQSTIQRLKDNYRIGVVEADIDSDIDAVRMNEAGVKTVQMHTNGMCHVDADMTRQALDHMDTNVDLLFLENVGNLICPAEFDPGCQLNVMILSVPEGDDKPLKYPLMFQKADIVILSKIDTLPYFSFDQNAFSQRIRYLHSNAVILPLSAKTGEGMNAWIDELQTRIRKWKAE